MKALGLFSVVLLDYFGQFTLAERFKWLLIPSLTIGLAIIYHTLLPVGFANNPQQLAVMTTSPQETVVVLKLEEWMANEAERSRCFLIDVRYPESFRRKHITGAVNIPVTSSDLAFLASLRNVAKDTPIVIYCQSEECPWSEMTARRRLFDAYRRVLVLEGGIEAYEGFLERRKAPARKENEP
jgi:rhodanese-related sulfurtransferase